MRGIEPDEIAIAAWVPAQRLTKPGYVHPELVPRVALTAHRREWPPPTGFIGWHAGAWVSGAVQLPPGVEIITGPRWRRPRPPNGRP